MAAIRVVLITRDSLVMASGDALLVPTPLDGLTVLAVASLEPASGIGLPGLGESTLVVVAAVGLV